MAAPTDSCRALQLYALVRASLPPGAKACQAAHGLRAYAETFPFIEAAWWRASNTLVLLETERLEELEARAVEQGITCVRFVQPAWAPEGTLTALVARARRAQAGARPAADAGVKREFNRFVMDVLPMCPRSTEHLQQSIAAPADATCPRARLCLAC
jgi:hypothetical protein